MTALATRGAESPVAALVKAAAPRLMAALPAHFSPEKVASLMSVLVYRTPKLMQCDPESLVTAVIQAGSLDLDLNPTLCEAYIIPRENWKTKSTEATFQPGYKGLEKLAVRTGSVKNIRPVVVCENDDFSFGYENNALKVMFRMARRDRGPMTHVFTLARMADGTDDAEVMDAAEIESIHQRSEGFKAAQRFKNAESGPWATDYNEMACKTVIKRHCKKLPRGTSAEAEKAFARLQQAIDLDNREYQGEEEPGHLAALNDNRTGHGSGAYAPPEAVREYQDWLKGFTAEKNAAWLDRHTDEFGNVLPGVKDLLSTFQVSGHLVKWGASAGLLNAPESGGKQRQKDPFAAVLWMRHRDELLSEAVQYARLQWKLEAARLAAARTPEPEEESQEPPVPSEDDGDPDYDIDFHDTPSEPGSDG